MQSKHIYVLIITISIILILYYVLDKNRPTETKNCPAESVLPGVEFNPIADTEVVDKIVSTKNPEDQQLLDLLTNRFIDVPNPFQTKVSYVLFKTPQASVVDTLLKEKEGGFFVECGALDGERSSNSFWLEIKRKWTGLLIEMDPSYYMQLRGKNRKAHSINACLSLKPYPQIMTFREHMKGEGKLIKNSMESGENRNLTLGERKTYCFPFLSLMRAMNVTHVDYLSLDVEGFELDILRTIPFDKIDISILSVEYNHQRKPAALKTFMKGQGYNFHKQLDVNKPQIYFGAHDYIFVKETLPIKN